MLAQWLPQAFLQALALPLLLVLCAATGYVMLSHLVTRVSTESFERWTLYTLGGFVAVSLVGVIWAYVGLFRMWTVFPNLLVLALAGRYGLKRALPSSQQPSTETAPTPGWVQAIAVLLLIGAGWLYAKPAESALLTDDSAVYSIGGTVLARDGTLYYRPDEVYPFAALDEPGSSESLHYLYQFSFPQSYTPVVTRHIGPFYRYPSGPKARIEIGFLALPKVWAALCVWAGGITASGLAVPFLGVLGLALLFSLANRLFGWSSALASMLVLGLSFSQFWFARFPLSEMHTQVVVLGAVLLVSVARRATHTAEAKALAAIVGTTLGLLGCLRFESPLLLAIMVPLVLVSISWRDQRPQMQAVLLASVATCWSVLLVGSVMTTPFYYVTRSINLMSPIVMRALFLSLAIGAAALAYARWRLGAWRGLGDAIDRLAPDWIVRGVGVGLALWLVHVISVVSGLDTREGVVRWLIDYWSALPFALACLSAAAYCWDSIRNIERTPKALGLVGLVVALLLVYTLNPMVLVSHPWAIRRTAAYIGPCLALGIAAIPSWLPRMVTRVGRSDRSARLTLSVLSWGAVAAAAFFVARPTWPLVDHQERQGSLDFLIHLGASLPEDALILLDDGPRARQYGPFLELVLGHPTYPLRTSQAHADNPQTVQDLLSGAQARNMDVCYIHDDGEAVWTLADWQLSSRAAIPLTVASIGTSNHAPPSVGDIVTHHLMIEVYDVVHATKNVRWGTQDHLVVPAGLGSYPYLADGFYTMEAQASETFRWTDASATLSLPWPSDDGELSSVCIAMDVNPWRPEGVSHAQVTIEVEDQLTYWEAMDPDLGRRTLLVSASDVRDDGSGTLDITMTTNPWVPEAEAAVATEPRQLGIMFYGADLTIGRPCLYSATGVYPKEETPEGESFRWTTDHAELSYIWPGAQDQPIDKLALDLSAPRQPNAEPVSVAILVEGKQAFAGDLGGARQTLVLDTKGIVNTGPSTLDISIEASTWCPTNVGYGEDPRDLGVMLYGLYHDD